MRKTISLTLMLSGFIELVTSIVLYIIPAGRVAYWTDYRLLGLSKTQWGDIHITVGFLLVFTGLIHFYLNWKAIRNYLKNKAREFKFFTKSFNIALVITLYVTIGSLFQLPPMNFVLSAGEFFTEQANAKYGEPPYGHAELSSLKMFCSRMNIDLSQALVLLENADIKVSSEKEIIQEISKNNGLTPQQIFECIQPAGTNSIVVETGKYPAFPDTPAPGFGNKTLKEICQNFGLSEGGVIMALKAAGISVNPEQTIKSIAAENDSSPMQLFEIIQAFTQGD